MKSNHSRELSQNSAGEDPAFQGGLYDNDQDLRREAASIIEEREISGLKGLVGGL